MQKNALSVLRWTRILPSQHNYAWWRGTRSTNYWCNTEGDTVILTTPGLESPSSRVKGRWTGYRHAGSANTRAGTVWIYKISIKLYIKGRILKRTIFHYRWLFISKSKFFSVRVANLLHTRLPKSEHSHFTMFFLFGWKLFIISHIDVLPVFIVRYLKISRKRIDIGCLVLCNLCQAW